MKLKYLTIFLVVFAFSCVGFFVSDSVLTSAPFPSSSRIAANSASSSSGVGAVFSVF